MHICKFCQSEKTSIKSLRSHERLCKSNPNKALTPFQDKQWQKAKGTNQFIKAKKEGYSQPIISVETRKKISDAVKNRPKKTSANSLKEFRLLCAFKFNVYDYPNEFPIDLINEYGWYSASNRGGNLKGVSRDHMISVKYAYDNDIDHNLISHPANCKLMIHNENVSKYSNCSISLDELIQKIDNWNYKYNLMGV